MKSIYIKTLNAVSRFLSPKAVSQLCPLFSSRLDLPKIRAPNSSYNWKSTSQFRHLFSCHGNGIWIFLGGHK